MRSDRPTWKSLISDTLPTHERISLVTMIFSVSSQVKMVQNLSGEDAQAFVDKIAEASSHTISRSRERPLTLVQISKFYQIGVGQSRATDTQEVPTLSVHDLWSPSPDSEVTSDSALLRSHGGTGSSW
jgi:hypothetical protein